MNNVLTDLGLEYVSDTSGYDALQAQIYEYYGVAGILSPRTHFDFPEPLELCMLTADIAAANHCHPLPGQESAAGKEQFFKHLLHPEAKTLLPFVTAALADEHKKSPVFAASRSLEIDRESIAQIIDRAYRLAGASGAVLGSQTKALLSILTLSELLIWQI